MTDKDATVLLADAVNIIDNLLSGRLSDRAKEHLYDEWVPFVRARIDYPRQEVTA